MADPRIAAYKTDFAQILDRWAEALRGAAGDSMARDSAILRFELTFEVAWKLLQHLCRHQGFEVSSPRQAIQQAFALGWVGDEELWSEILRARNTAGHVYRESYAKSLAEELPKFHQAFVHLWERIREE